MTRGLLLDLDDTLYAYAPAERAARTHVLPSLASALDAPHDAVSRRLDDARRAVHGRIGTQGAGHSRRLYFSELLHAAHRPDLLPHVLGWEEAYWKAFGNAMVLRPGVRELLEAWRAAGHRTAIVTDLVFDVQVRKLETLGLWSSIDALATSEEAGADKPDPRVLLLAGARLGVPVDRCVMVGDRDDRDGAAARSLGLPFVRVDPASADFNAVRTALGL